MCPLEACFLSQLRCEATLLNIPGALKFAHPLPRLTVPMVNARKAPFRQKCQMWKFLQNQKLVFSNDFGCLEYRRYSLWQNIIYLIESFKGLSLQNLFIKIPLFPLISGPEYTKETFYVSVIWSNSLLCFYYSFNPSVKGFIPVSKVQTWHFYMPDMQIVKVLEQQKSVIFHWL